MRPTTRVVSRIAWPVAIASIALGTGAILLQALTRSNPEIATRTIERFSAHLREAVDIDALGAELLTIVTATMQPSHVSLWIRERGTA